MSENKYTFTHNRIDERGQDVLTRRKSNTWGNHSHKKLGTFSRGIACKVLHESNYTVSPTDYAAPPVFKHSPQSGGEKVMFRPASILLKPSPNSDSIGPETWESESHVDQC